jgi:hypothetical protein
VLAIVAEWYSRPAQNRMGATPWRFKSSRWHERARVAGTVDAIDLKSVALTGLRVRLPPLVRRPDGIGRQLCFKHRGSQGRAGSSPAGGTDARMVGEGT